MLHMQLFSNLFENQEQGKLFLVEGWVVHILGFDRQLTFVTAIQLCYCGKAAIDNSTTNGCGSVPRKLYLGK